MNILDLKVIAADIKDTLSAAIADLRVDIRSLADRVTVTEKALEDHDRVLHRATGKIDDHTLQLRHVNRHLEDLDNRGRRRNLRVRGFPESVEEDPIQHEVITIFNNVLGRPPQSPIAMERIHRALRPRGRDTDPPRDVVCCLVDFKLKEDVLKQARSQRLVHSGSPIQIYQDLLGITLQHRRDLRPLLDALRGKEIRYKWKFPFCLSASHQGRTAHLKVPEDLPRFCETLGLPLISVPDWYAPYRRSVGRWNKPREVPMETQTTRFRRHRSPSDQRLSPGHQEPREIRDSPAAPGITDAAIVVTRSAVMCSLVLFSFGLWTFINTCFTEVLSFSGSACTCFGALLGPRGLAAHTLPPPLA